MDKTILIIAILMFACILSVRALATQTIFDNLNVTGWIASGRLKVASCDVKAYINGTLYCGSDATGTAGANISSTTCSGTQKVSAVNNATGVVTCSADVDTANTSAEIWAVIDNNTFHKFSQTITWGNLSSWSLNNAWTGSLGWGNISEYDLNSVWTGTLGGGNITSGTITSTQLNSNLGLAWGNLTGYSLNVAWTGSLGWGNLTGYDLNEAWINSLGGGNITAGSLSNASLNSTFKILLGNVTDVSNCTSGQLVQGKVGSAWVCTADLFNTSTQMDSAINATANRYFQLKVNESSYLNGQPASYYLTTAGGITFSNITDIANCSAGQVVKGKVGSAWVCVVDATGGGSGTNYWQTDGAAWMWANETAGGYNSINMTTVNASNFYQDGNAVCDDSDNCAYISDSAEGDLNVNSSDYWDGLNDPSDINAADITDDNTYIAVGDTFGGDVSGTYDALDVVNTQGITWGNISAGWSLNQAWTGSLGGGNLTTGTVTSTQIADGTIATADLASGFAINFGNISAGWDLNKAWTNSLGGGNLTAGTVSNTSLTSTFKILLGNVTDVANCTSAQKVLGKVGSAWVCDNDLFNTSTQMDAAINATANRYFQLKVNESSYLNGQASTYYLNTGGFNAGNLTSGTITNIGVTGTGWLNSSTGGKYNNDTKLYFGTQGQYCIYYNSTLGALVSTNVC